MFKSVRFPSYFGPSTRRTITRPSGRGLLLLFLLLTRISGPLLAQTSPQTFAFTGAAQTFIVPAGVTSLSVVANGAQGASFQSMQLVPGGNGGRVTALLTVVPGQVLTINVGGGGTSGYNGGGVGSGIFNTVYGGGATDIRTNGTALANRVIVAGGGGGASGRGGGGAGGATLTSGTLGQGGSGDLGANSGGGGGGFYGGAGGVNFNPGGGGSSYTDPALASNVVQTQGVNTGNGSLTLSWTAATLPVTLRYFNGRMTEAGALLGWATAREDNNARFQIERGRDRNAGTGIGFEAIATLPSQAPNGNSLTELSYTYLDTRPLPGTNYYRLVQTDRDGTTTRSKIIALSQEATPAPVLYPNPVGSSGEAVLEPALVHTGYVLTDVQGRVVQQTNVPGLLSRVSVANLPAGVYLLRVQTEGGTRQTFKLMR